MPLPPFIGKKLYTATGFVSKFNFPTFTPTIPTELQNLGVKRLEIVVNENKFSYSSHIHFIFNIYGLNDIFGSEFRNPYKGGRLEKHLFNIEINGSDLVKINDIKAVSMLSYTDVLNSYESAVKLKADYEKTVKQIPSNLHKFID